MAAAGVRTLVSAVEIELLECQNPTESTLVTQRVRERRLQLARVLEAQSSGGNLQEKLAELDKIRFESAELLQVQYKLSVFDRILTSKPENCPALFRVQSQLLLFVALKDRLPWHLWRRWHQAAAARPGRGKLRSYVVKDSTPSDDPPDSPRPRPGQQGGSVLV